MIFKSMTREAPKMSTRTASLGHDLHLLPYIRCERCDKLMFMGDWPFCKGNPQDHVRE